MTHDCAFTGGHQAGVDPLFTVVFAAQLGLLAACDVLRRRPLAREDAT